MSQQCPRHRTMHPITSHLCLAFEVHSGRERRHLERVGHKKSMVAEEEGEGGRRRAEVASTFQTEEGMEVVPRDLPPPLLPSSLASACTQGHCRCCWGGVEILGVREMRGCMRAGSAGGRDLRPVDAMASRLAALALALLVALPGRQEQQSQADKGASTARKLLAAETRVKIESLLRGSESLTLSLRGGSMPEYLEVSCEEHEDLFQPFHPSADLVSSNRVYVDAENGNDDSVTSSLPAPDRLTLRLHRAKETSNVPSSQFFALYSML
eukprot:753656-Hanusia_phi.AAC.3